MLGIENTSNTGARTCIKKKKKTAYTLSLYQINFGNTRLLLSRIANIFFSKFPENNFVNGPNGQVVDVLAFRRERPGSHPNSIKLTQVAIDLTPLQRCTVSVGASCGNGLRQLATSSPVLRRV